MAGKTISAYTDEETARLAEQIARLEHRKISQIAASALAFYVRLPPAAHEALRYVAALGTAEEMNLMLREVTRAMNISAYDASVRSMVPALRERYGDSLQTEEEITAEAVRLTRTERPLRKAVADTEARTPRRRAR